MLSSTPGTGCFIQIPDESSNCILHPMKVQEFTENSYTAELQGANDASLLEIEQDIFIYYEFKNEFMRQPARIDVIADISTGFTFAFQFTADAVSAERRQCYRVSTVMVEVNSAFGDESNCSVLDVSATGFAVLATRQYKVADIIAATIQFDGEAVKAECRIESIKKLDKAGFRYGVHCINSKSSGGRLLKELQYICATVQRQQLRRMSQAS